MEISECATMSLEDKISKDTTETEKLTNAMDTLETDMVNSTTSKKGTKGEGTDGEVEMQTARMMMTTTTATTRNLKMLPVPLPLPSSSSKTLKRCLSVPIIHTNNLGKAIVGQATTKLLLAQSEAFKTTNAECIENNKFMEQSKMVMMNMCQQSNDEPMTATAKNLIGSDSVTKKIHMCSNPSSRDVSPTPVINIFAPRARRYSASYSPRGGNNVSAIPPLCLTSRVSQLRQEECIDMKTREVNHEREVHSAIQISQSWEDLTLATENWSCKSDELGNPLQVILPTGSTKCSSTSPSSNRANANLRVHYSPSPTRRIFATRRSMSPIAIRPSQLAPVKRKFELDDANNASSWNVYSPPPLKKIFTDSNSSSVCQSPSSVCPSPDSGTFDGRITPMDDARSETSSISGWSINNESSSCDSGAKSASSTTAPSFVNKLVDLDNNTNLDVCNGTTKNQKSFYINKQGISGTKKYIVNHAGSGGLEQPEQNVKNALITDIVSGGIK